MTWAEFLIRLHGFRRDQEKGVMMLRELSWMVYVSPHQDPKKMKKTIDAFWPLKKSVSKEKRDVMIERFKEAQIKYLEEKKVKDG